MKDVSIIALIIIICIVFLLLLRGKSAECENKGGFLLKGAYTVECVKVTRI